MASRVSHRDGLAALAVAPTAKRPRTMADRARARRWSEVGDCTVVNGRAFRQLSSPPATDIDRKYTEQERVTGGVSMRRIVSLTPQPLLVQTLNPCKKTV